MKILLLAGTREARALAARLADEPRVDVLASLAGATRAPSPLAVPTRVGGFGGEAAQERFIRDHEIDAVIDATHPFADRISRRTQAICARLGMAYLCVLRPGWKPGPGDLWTFVDRTRDVPPAVPPGATVFLGTGPGSLARLDGLAGHCVFCRRIDPPEAPFPLPRGGWIVGRPPFSVHDEIALFQRLAIDALVVKDAGGGAEAKLAAARELRLPVVLIRRPPPPPGDKAASIAAAAWIEARL